MLVRSDAELGFQSPIGELRTEAERASVRLSIEEVRWRPVIPSPRRIICLGLNYRAHIEETGREDSDYPVLFTKWASSLLGHGEQIVLPPEATAPDYEAELAVVIGRAGRRIPADRALSHVAGVTVANDITMRDFQYKTHQWLQGKAWDASTPLGPYLVTLDEVGALDALEIRLELNGIEMQRSTTGHLIFDVPRIIETVSTFTQLEPGDLILTGTPGGVGHRRDPPVHLRAGDLLTVEIARVGVLTNTVVG